MNPSHGPNCSVKSVVVVPLLDAWMILQSNGLGCSAQSGKQDTRTFSYFRQKGIAQQRHLFLFASFSWKRNENKQKVCHSFYLSLCVALCLVVSLHIVVVCVIFMAISLRFGECLLSLICCEL